MSSIIISHNFVFIANAIAKLKSVGYDDTLTLTGFPTELTLMLSVGDFVDFPKLEKFMFVVMSRRFSFKADGIDITYLIDLASDDCNAPHLKIVK